MDNDDTLQQITLVRPGLNTERSMTRRRRIRRLAPTDTFPRRHIGPDPDDVQAMLQTLGLRFTGRIGRSRPSRSRSGFECR